MRRERIARREKRTRTVRKCLVILAFCLLIFLVGWAGRKVYDDLAFKRMLLIPVAYGTLADHAYGQALVINREHLVKAPRAGRFENSIRSNEKVRKGQILGYLTNPGQPAVPVYSPSTGIFTMSIDGLEEVLNDTVLNAVGPESYKYVPRTVNADSDFSAGEAVGKIVDNLRPSSLIVKLDEDQNISFEPGGRVLVKSDGGEMGTARINEIREDDLKLVWLDMDNFSEELLEPRYVKLMLENIDKPGFLVPVGAIIKNEQENIVYCYREGKIFRQNVSVIKVKEGQAVVAGVKLNDMVVGNPHVVGSGHIVN